MMTRLPSQLRLAGATTLLSVALVACGSDGSTTPIAMTSAGVVVLDGFIQPGLTLLPDSGPSTGRIIFGGPEEFDAGAFTLRNDTVLAASSRGAGDQLFLADLRAQSVFRVGMPAGSNPAGARLLEAGGGNARIAVPLRDSGSVLLASVPSGVTSPTVLGISVIAIGQLGRCPVDVAEAAGALWVLDANAQCSADYTPVGDMRLIRVALSSGAPTGLRDTILLPGLRGSSGSILVRDGLAYVTASGDADFSAFPFTLRTEGAIARVDLAASAVQLVRQMPAGSYGSSARFGEDGTLNVTLFEDLADFASRTIVMSLPALEATGTRVSGREWRSLRDTTGAQVSCAAGTTDGLGRLHCIQNRAASATFLLVFAPDGTLVREEPAGQGGVDLRLR